MPVAPINTERSVHPAAKGIVRPRTGRHTTPNQPVNTEKLGVSPLTAGGWGLEISPLSKAANALVPGGCIG